MLTLRGFIDDDSQLAMRLKEQAGWNQIPADLARFRRLAPGGSFAAIWDGEPVGCVMTFEFGNVAWIAMMLVDEAFRGRGIGRALMDRALEHLDAKGIATIRLDATSLGEPLYAKLGFVPQFQVGRYAGSIPADMAMTHEAASGAPGVLLPALDEHIEEIIDLDRDATRTDRRKLLLTLFDEYRDELRVVIHERRVIGYCLSRPGAHARQIGPCISDSSAGERLLGDAVRRHVDARLYIDVPLVNAAGCGCMEGLGLAVQRTLTRMCRGATVSEDTKRLFASSGPEKG